LTTAQSNTKPVRLDYKATSSSTKTFNTYAECYKKVLSNADKDARLANDPDKKKAIKKFV